MKIKRLVIGTYNKAKLEEWGQLLSEGGVPVMGISEIGGFLDVEETGNTFAENARLKARHYASLTGEFVLSEDGGYEVEALGGLPGVKSRRILPGDKDGTDDELIDYVLERLQGVPLEKRGVRLTVAVALSSPSGEIIFEDEGSSQGVVAQERGPVLIPGYPFRTIHWLPEPGKTYAELTEKEHERYNHKRPIAKRLIKFLSDFE